MKKYCLLISFLWMAVWGFAQIKPNGIIREKVFVHTDRNTYLPTERLWYKVYVTRGSNNTPSPLSRIAYLEILDNTNQSIIQMKIPVNHGSGDGSVVIPADLKSGTYILRAYTKWMENEDAAYFFHKQIQIINPRDSSVLSTKKERITFDFQLFPEGGNLVDGITTKLAYKMTDEYGKAMDFKAYISSGNDTIAKLIPYHLGMGSILFSPDIKKEYKVIIETSSHEIFIKPIPTIYQFGTVLNVSDINDKVLVNIKNNWANQKQLELVVHANEQVIFQNQFSSTQNSKAFDISKTELADGMNYFTLFADGQPVAERMFFKMPTTKLDIGIRLNQKKFINREKVIASFSTNDAGSFPVDASGSISVYKLNPLNPIDSLSVYTYLWLNADLKGYVQNPNYYFSNGLENHKLALDNLLLTQGWRKFNTNKTNIAEIEGHLIYAKVIDAITEKPKADAHIYMSVLDDPLAFYAAISDSSGIAIFNPKEVYSNNQLIFQNDENDSTLRIQLINPFYEGKDYYAIDEFEINKNWQANLNSDFRNVQINQAFLGDKYFKEEVKPVPEPFYGKPEKVYRLKDYNKFNTLEEIFKEYIPEVYPRKSKEGYKLKTFYTGREMMMEGNPLVLYNDVPVFNIDALMKIDPAKIEQIGVIPSKYIFGPFVFEGVVSFYTDEHQYDKVLFNNSSLIMDYKGIQEKRQFYAPIYDNESVNSKMPDFRNLLYWDPKLEIDRQGKSATVFYTSDDIGKYIGVIQAMDKKGNLGYQTFTFEVGKQEQ